MLRYKDLKDKEEIFNNMRNLGYQITNENSRDNIRFVNKSEDKVVMFNTLLGTFQIWEKGLFVCGSKTKAFKGEDFYEQIANAMFHKSKINVEHSHFLRFEGLAKESQFTIKSILDNLELLKKFKKTNFDKFIAEVESMEDLTYGMLESLNLILEGK